MSLDDPLTAEELRRVALRERDRRRKQTQRARLVKERAREAVKPNASGYQVPPMPGGLAEIRRWVRSCHDAYSRREIGPIELGEARKSAAAVGELYKVGAEIRKSQAALRSAEAQEKLADSLLEIQHGGVAMLMLARLQSALTEGKQRPLPRAPSSLPTPPEDAA
jgi:hypothetical protein